MSKHLVVCDLGSIETRGTYWCAGDPALDEVFGKGLDAYVHFAQYLYGKTYAELDPKIKGLSEDEKEDRKNKRQLAKPAVLGCGYGLGGGDWGVDKNGDDIKTGLFGYSENMGVPLEKEFSHECVQKYRKAYPFVPKAWRSLENAAIQAVQTGRQFEACRMVFGCVKPGKLLYVILPSGRRLHYIRPRVETTERWDGEFSSKLKYENQIGHGFWGHTWTWGGKIMENVVQALSRDLLRDAMLRAKDEGFSIVGHSHDEIICEEEVGSRQNVELLRECMITRPSWAQDLPLDAEGWEGRRYHK